MNKNTKEPDWYNLLDIRAHLKLSFEGTVLTSTDFLKMALAKVADVNERLKGQRIQVKNTSFEKFLPADFIFKFKVSLFGRDWTLYHGFTHFQQLAAELKKLTADQVSLDLPKLPCKPADFSADLQSKLLEVGEALARELAAVINTSNCQKKVKAVLNFLSISKPFCELKYEKVYEFACEKHSSGPVNEAVLVKTLKSVFRGYHKRWVVISATNLFYFATPEDRGSDMKDNIAFDSQTTVQLLEFHADHMVIEFTLSRRSVKLRVSDALKGLLSLHYIAKLYRKSAYCKTHRFDSFAPVRPNNDCTLFADGAGYFKELYENLEKAQHTIMITDWWFAPEMPLLRKDDLDLETEESRIDFTLARAADRGVKVYLIVYKEMSQTLGNDSEHAKKRLECLSPNIKVLRHPNVIVSLWSHHEKMVAIDKKVVFIGGLDICWGRWDDHEHRLFNPKLSNLFPGADYYNPLKKDITRGRLYKNAWIPTTHPRMPWHDIAAKLTGTIVIDYTNHFITYWNHARETSNEAEILYAKRLSQVSFKELPPAPQQPKPEEEVLDVVPIDPYESNPGASTDAFVFEASHSEDQQLDQLADAQIRLASIVRGGRSSFTDESDINSGENRKLLEAEYNRQLLLTSEGKHGSIIPSVEPKDSAPAEDYSSTPTPSDAANKTFSFEADDGFFMSSNNCDQYASAHLPSAQETRATFEPMRASLGGQPDEDEEEEIETPPGGELQEQLTAEVSQITGNQSAQEAPTISAELASFVEEDTGKLTMQALRSASRWSLGKLQTEHSICNAYRELIAGSKQFIYIENQFFISSTSDQGVKNEIVQCLVDRILRAVSEGAKFRVVIFMPLMPSFEANLEDSKGKVMQFQIGLQNHTIAKGKNSLLMQLRAKIPSSAGVKVEDFIQICSLRRWERRPADQAAISEIVYIHSKLMIVDDQRLVLGSANLNDRSMLGDRDSELAVCMDGAEDSFITDPATGQKVGVNQQIHQFRRSIFREHFGADLEWPVADEAWARMWRIAETNTNVYDQVFKTYPSNKYPTYKALHDRDKAFDPQAFEASVPSISGHAVLYPYNFLKKENLLAFSLKEPIVSLVPLYGLQ